MPVFQRSQQQLSRSVTEVRRFLRRGGRRVWSSGQRVHVELRELPPQPGEAVAALEAAAARVRGVAWARVRADLGALVVQHRIRARQPQARRAAVERLEDALVRAVVDAETALGLNRAPLSGVAHPERHPGHWTPLARTLLELGVDAASVAGGWALRRAGVGRPSLGVDLAALQSAMANTPALRRWLERYLGIALTEVGLELSGALLHAVLQGELGAAADILHRSLRLRELAARRRLWQQWEPRLCADGELVAPPPAARPRPLPDGPFERYAASAAAGTLAAFAATLFARGEMEQAAAAIFGGLPKPARRGRAAFAAQLGYRLARAGVMVMEPQVLRHLERLDTVAVSAALIDTDPQGASRLLDAAARAQFGCVVVGSRVLDAAAGRVRHLALHGADAVRALQEEGHGVMFFGRGPDDAYAAADCSMALWDEGSLPAAGAHLHCDGGLAQAAALVEAAATARRAAEQVLQLSMAEVALSLALSAGGLDRQATRRIMAAASAASVVAMADGLRLAQGLAWPASAASAAVAAPAWHRLTADEVLHRLGSRLQGLSAEEAAARRPVLPPTPPRLLQLARLMLDELRNPMTPALAAGAGLSLLAGGAVDALLVAAVLAVNTAYGGLQRYRADALVRQLSRHERSCLRVRRDGAVCSVADDELAVGDVLELGADELVPADCRILEACDLEVDESSLTGESLPVAKAPGPCDAANLAERRCMLYQGTAVSAGTAVAVVVALGADTELGRAAAASDGTAFSSGVEARLAQLTRYTVPVAAASALALAASERMRGRPLREVLSTAVSLAVAAVPEGLPLLASLAQLAAAGRLSRRGALVRSARAIEALGRIDLLCCDKTGTLTEGRIRLVRVSDGDSVQAADALDEAHREIVAVALRASPSSSGGAPVAHMTDRALIEAAHAAEVGSHDGLSDWQRLHEMPFQSARAFHASLAEHGDGRLISVKGAPEVVLPRCRSRRLGGSEQVLDRAGREALLREARALAGRGYRVLAVAEREAHEKRPIDPDRVDRLGFRGFIAFADPVRPSARAAVDQLRRAGVGVVMLTGDHPDTAAAIAADLGLDGGRRVVTGAELDALGDAELAALAPQVAVFARVTPAHKVRIVRAFQSLGRTVGMTGDGANDAPAIRLADVGIALGERSTAAARNAAGLVVTDGRIETLVGAVLEGRALWLSVRDALGQLVGGNLGEIAFTLAGGLLGGRAPLNARQLLLVNLLTDALPALALALRPPAGKTPEDLLRAGPEASLGPELMRELSLRAGITATVATAAWTAARLGGRRGAGSVGLLALTGTQLTQALLVGRGNRAVTLASLGSLAALVAVVQTPVLSQFFGCRPLGPIGLLQAAAASAAGGAAQALLPRLLRLGGARS
ncbi:MAG: HAD-IC family P-type ATPase [Pseudomonadota bacterium]